MTRNSKFTGDLTEITVAHRLIQFGCNVAIPFGDNEKYDLVADYHGELFRLQCKTAWESNAGAIRFNTHSQTTKDGEYHETNYRGEIDAFIVRYPDEEELFWIPIRDATKLKMDLRFEAAIDHPAINWADDYRLDERLASL